MVVTTFGEEPLTLNYENIDVSPNTLAVYLNSNSTMPLSQETLNFTLAGQKLEIKEIHPMSQMEESVTYLFIADVSGSISDHNIEIMKSFISGIASYMRPQDRVSIMLLGNTLNEAPFVSGADNIQAQIAGITPAREDTNLYAGIIKGLDILNTDSEVSKKRCLIVLSDGEDYFETGYTREEVNEKIKQSNVPIHTIAVLDEHAEASMLETAKILGSFARLSPGGMDITYGINSQEGTSQDIDPVSACVEQLEKKMAEGYFVTADLSQVSLENDQCLLEIELIGANHEMASDEVLLSASVIREVIVPVETAEPIESSVGETEETSQPEESPQAPDEATRQTPESTSDTAKGTDVGFKLDIWVILGIAALGAMIIGIVLWLFGRKKKGITQEIEQKREVGEDEQQKEILQTEKLEADETNGSLEDNNEGMNIDQEEICDEEMECVPAPCIKIKFIKVGSAESESYAFEMEDQLIIGRSTVDAQFCMPRDDLLSARHCKIYALNHQLYIQDLHSTNGTYLNGIPVTQPYRLEQDDIILAGSMELRVTWERGVN